MDFHVWNDEEVKNEVLGIALLFPKFGEFKSLKFYDNSLASSIESPKSYGDFKFT